MSIWHLATRNGNQMGRLLIAECLASAGLPFIRQHPFDSSGTISLPNVADRLLGYIKCLADFRIRPVFVTFEEYSRTRQRACIRFSSPHEDLHMASFVVAKVNRSGSNHGSFSCFSLSISQIQTG